MSTTDPAIETMLRAHAPHAPNALRARVLELRPVAAQRRTWPPRRLALVVLPAAAALAVAAALVHGAVDSRHPAQRSLGAPADSAAGIAGTSGRSVGQATSTTESAARVAAAPVQQKASTPSVASSRLTNTDASLQVQVRDGDALSAATSQATRIATSLGGYAKSVSYSDATDGGSATLDLRVPAENVKTAVARLSQLGTIVSQQLFVTDLQDRFRQQSDQIAQLRRRVAALTTALRTEVLQDAQRVLLRIKLAEAKRALAQRVNARRGTVQAAANASISLTIGTARAVAPPPQPKSRVDRMLHSAVGFLGLEAMVALYALIVVSPFALAAALVWLWRRRSVERLLQS